MALIQASVAAATAVVGYDLFQGKPNAQISPGQVVKRAGMLGSAVAGDTRVDLMAGNRKIGELYNRALGFPAETDMFDIDYRHRGPSERLYAIVVDAPATNAINLAVTIVP